MKAAGLYGIQDIRLQEIDKPALGAGEILMKVEAATTCGTDLKTYLRGYPGLEFPIMPWGHECAGSVADKSADVTKFDIGDRIAMCTPAPCFQCFYCKRRRYDLCENITLAMGAYAEYFRLPAQVVAVNTFAIPEHVSFAQASLLEPLASAVHGFMRAGGVNPGDTVVVIGAGAQGLTHIQLARLSGAVSVIAIDMVDYRLDVARQLGATDAINADKEHVEERVRQLTDHRGAELVIEAVGTTQTWEMAVRLARKGGTVLEYGGCAKGTSFNVDTGRLHYDGLTITGCTHKTPEYADMAWRLIVSGALQTGPMVTRQVALEEINEAFRLLANERTEIKIAITP